MAAMNGATGEKKYLLENNVPALMDDLVRSVLQQRPEDPKAFMGAWLRDASGAPATEKPQGTSPGNKLTLESTDLDNEAESQVERISVDMAAELLLANNALAFDCRGEEGTYHIVGARRIAVDDVPLPNEFASSCLLPGKGVFLFFSNTSPDLDLRAACSFVDALGPKVDAVRVCVVEGGLNSFFPRYSTDDNLVVYHDNSAPAKVASLTLTADETEALQINPIMPTEAAQLAMDPETKEATLFVDCRDASAKGCIPFAVRAGVADMQELVAQFGTTKRNVIFFSTISPDIDDHCANEYSSLFAAAYPEADLPLVATMSEGVAAWVQEFGTNKELWNGE